MINWAGSAAGLMAALTPAQLDALYGRHGEPSYLPPLKALWLAAGGGL